MLYRFVDRRELKRAGDDEGKIFPMKITHVPMFCLNLVKYLINKFHQVKHMSLDKTFDFVLYYHSKICLYFFFIVSAYCCENTVDLATYQTLLLPLYMLACLL